MFKYQVSSKAECCLLKEIYSKAMTYVSSDLIDFIPYENAPFLFFTSENHYDGWCDGKCEICKPGIDFQCEAYENRGRVITFLRKEKLARIHGNKI